LPSLHLVKEYVVKNRTYPESKCKDKIKKTSLKI